MSAPHATPGASPRRWMVALPLIGFMAVAALFLFVAPSEVEGVAG